MSPPPASNTSAAGLLWAGAIFVGAACGIALDQPSAGFVLGVATGAGIALWLYLRERNRA